MNHKDVTRFLSESAFWIPDHLHEPYPWAGHIPFAFWLVGATRPRVLVELGTHWGNSYFAFCQAVARNGLQTRCYAVDHWEGDIHSGLYREGVYRGVHDINLHKYARFSTLIKSSFDNALDMFDDGSIDLLHIDGCHTHEAVEHDFNLWTPKLSDRGVVLFHDTNIRHGDFGVYRLFDELSLRYPSHAFLHSCGLGLIAVGPEIPEELGTLLEATKDSEAARRINRVYERLGMSLVDKGTRVDLESRLLDLEKHATELHNDIQVSRGANLGLQARIGALNNDLTSFKSHLSGLLYELGIEPRKASSTELQDVEGFLRKSTALISRELDSLKDQLQLSRLQHSALEGELGEIRSSLTWLAGQQLSLLRRGWFPSGSLRMRALGLGTRFAKLTLTHGVRVATARAARKLRTKFGMGTRLDANAITHTADGPEPTCDPCPTFDDLPWKCGEGVKAPNRGRAGHFKVLLVSHEASRTGAPLCLLMLAEQLARIEHIDCRVVLARSGEMREEFSAVAPTILADDLIAAGLLAEDVPHNIAMLFRQHISLGVAVCNTASIGPYFEAFRRYSVPVLAWIHELPTSIDAMCGGEAVIRVIEAASRCIITPAEFVSSALVRAYRLNHSHIRTIYNGVKLNFADDRRESDRMTVRQELGIPADAPIVLGCGTVDIRKGADLFLQVAQSVIQTRMEEAESSVPWFVWVGKSSPSDFMNWLGHDARNSGLEERVRFIGPRQDPYPYFRAADIFLLSSREDPCPLVNMEAMSSGLPVVAFRGGGGSSEVLGDHGVTVPYLDVASMAEAVCHLLDEPAKRTELGVKARESARKLCRPERFAGEVLALLREQYSCHPPVDLKVSVVVPNFNHGRFLQARLESIFNQTLAPFEIIYIDNRSTDDSVEIAQRFAARSPVPMRVIVNDQNNGSTFKQWYKGLGLARGDLVWIAESDDTCRPDFLERLVPEFYDPDVVLAYSQSAIIGPAGERYADNYHAYTDDISTTRWRSRYCVPGREEIAVALSQKNTIPNASAVLFRHPGEADYLADMIRYRFAGDWFFYGMRIREGKIAFLPESLNHHRRHPATVTHSFEQGDRHIEETMDVRSRLIASVGLSRNTIARSIGVAVQEDLNLRRNHQLDRPPLLINPIVGHSVERIRESMRDASGGQGLSILFVLPDLEIGGGQIAAIRLANALAKRHEVFICNSRPELSEPGMVGHVDDRVTWIEGAHGLTPWSSTGDRVEIVRELIRFHKIQVVCSHVWWADIFTHELNISRECAWYIHMHGCYEGLLEHPEWDPRFSEAVGPMFGAARGIFYGVERNLRVFSQFHIAPPGRQVRVFNGLDPSALERGNDGSVVRKLGDFIYGLASRAIPEKGWEEAIRAVRRINALPADLRGGRTVRLVLIGGGNYAEMLESRHGSDPHIQFLGRVDDVVGVMAQCDAGLLPSRFVCETVPSSVIESLACGLPVVATDRGAVPEMIRFDEKEAGLVVRLKPDLAIDEDRLAEAMLRYLNEPDLYREHCNSARFVFQHQFHIDRIARTCEAEFHLALGPTRVDSGEPRVPAMHVQGSESRRPLQV